MLHFTGPVAEIFGKLGFLLIAMHDSVGYKIAATLKLVSLHTPITDTERLSIEVIVTAFWTFTYGALGLLWSYFASRRNLKRRKSVSKGQAHIFGPALDD